MEKSRARWLVAGLVAVHFALHVTTFTLSFPGDLSLMPASLGTLVYALLILGPSQGVLVAVWAILRGEKPARRALLLILGTATYVAILAQIPRGFLVAPSCLCRTDWLPITIGEMCVFGPFLMTARLTGLRLVWMARPDSQFRPFQFCIRDILIWTTAVAVLLGSCRYLLYALCFLPRPSLSPYAVWRGSPEDTFFLLFPFPPLPLAVFASLMMVAAISMFSSLGRGWIVARIVRLLLFVAFAAELLYLANDKRSAWWFFPGLLSLMAFWLVPSFLVLRVAGYRLAWRPLFEQPQEEIAA